MRKVIVADDSKFMRKIIRRVVESLGLKVVGEARNGAEAINYVKLWNPDMLILDINMPDVDGLTALKHIISSGYKPKVIMLTAINQEWAINAAKKFGAVAYIPKPFKPQQLAEVIKNVIRK